MAAAEPLSDRDFGKIKLLVLDFDGVLTDNRVYVDQTGQEGVFCHRGDGWGIARVRETGCEVFVLSTEANPVVTARCRKLQIECVQDCADKLVLLKDLAAARDVDQESIAYVGNDVNDLTCMQWAGLPISVADAEPEVLAAAKFVTGRAGGKGAVREVCDRLIAARRKKGSTETDLVARMPEKATTIAFIPVRGGSRSIPLKNIKLLGGKPLVQWTVDAALACPKIDQVVVSTDSDAIRQILAGNKLEPRFRIVDRSPETATDEASTESAMLEFARSHQFDHIILIQATSPLLTAADLERGLERYRSGNVDSVLSAVREKRFLWQENENGTASPVNYDYRYRPRRQDFAGSFVENGAFYITSRPRLLESQCRLSGRIGIVEMPPQTIIELDEPEDWAKIEILLSSRHAP